MPKTPKKKKEELPREAVVAASAVHWCMEPRLHEPRIWWTRMVLVWLWCFLLCVLLAESPYADSASGTNCRRMIMMAIYGLNVVMTLDMLVAACTVYQSYRGLALGAACGAQILFFSYAVAYLWLGTILHDAMLVGSLLCIPCQFELYSVYAGHETARLIKEEEAQQQSAAAVVASIGTPETKKMK